MTDDAIAKEFQEVKSRPYIPPPTNTLSPGYHDVGWGIKENQSHDVRTDLITRGMVPCHTLVIINDTEKTQSMAHIFPQEDIASGDRSNPALVDTVKEMVKKYGRGKARYFIVGGQEGMSVGNVAENIYSELHNAGVPNQAIAYVPPEKNELGSQNIAVRNGQLMRASDNLCREVHIKTTFEKLDQVNPAALKVLNTALERVLPKYAEDNAEQYQKIQERVDFSPPKKREKALLLVHNSKYEKMDKRIADDPAVKALHLDESLMRDYFISVQHQIDINPEKYLSSKRAETALTASQASPDTGQGKPLVQNVIDRHAHDKMASDDIKRMAQITVRALAAIESTSTRLFLSTNGMNAGSFTEMDKYNAEINGIIEKAAKESKVTLDRNLKEKIRFDMGVLSHRNPKIFEQAQTEAKGIKTSLNLSPEALQVLVASGQLKPTVGLTAPISGGEKLGGITPVIPDSHGSKRTLG